MGYEVTFDVSKVGPFVCGLNKTTYIPGSCTGIGVIKDGELIGGALYCQYNGHSVWAHIGGVGRWVTRELLFFLFDYPFRQLGVNQILGQVDGCNAKAIRFDEHLGFERVAEIPQAGKDGSDLLIYSMKKNACRWLNEQTRYAGRS